MPNKHKGILALLVFLVLLFFYYNIGNILNKDIQGAHIWRQADCMAMVENYKQFKLPFYKPATYNLQSNHGNVVGEFPLFYFIASKSTNSAFVLRLMNFMVLCLSIIAIYYIVLYFIKQQMYALVVAMLMCTSPLLMYYGTNFLSDATAVAFLFLAFAFYLYSTQYRINKYLSILCFILSVLFKASYALFIIVPLYVYYNQNKNQLKLKGVIKILLVLIIPTLWYVYAKYYNQINHDTYYFLSIQPIWTMSFHDIGLSIWRVFKSNFYIYFQPVFSIITILFFIYSCFKNKSNEVLKYTIVVFVITILYAVLFLQKFIQHDYYYLFFMPFILMLLIQSIVWIKNKLESKNYTYLILFIILLVNIYYCKQTINEMQKYSSVSSKLLSQEFQNFLNQNNCTSKTIVFCADDASPNVYLYSIKRKGYTVYNVNRNQNIKDYDFLITTNKNKLKKQVNAKSYKGIYLEAAKEN